MAQRSRGSVRSSANGSEKRPAWIQRRASERPVARWIAWATKRRRAGREAQAQSAPDTVQGATIIDFLQWKAAHARR